MLTLLLVALGFASSSDTVPTWNGETVRDLHNEYNNIFKYGNRNAASHLWSSFLLDRSSQMDAARLELMFSGYCAVSGSPVRPGDYNRYRYTLPLVTGGVRTGFMYHCCWPCVCDTEDWIRVDTKTIQTSDGEKEYHFAVLGNPCDHPEKLEQPFEQSFGGGQTTLQNSAPEVRCGDGGVLKGATLSDNGYVIIALFFDDEEDANNAGALEVPLTDPTPGRVSQTPEGVMFHDQREFDGLCSERKEQGFNSGMGKIFVKVAEISPITIPDADDNSKVEAAESESQVADGNE